MKTSVDFIGEIIPIHGKVRGNDAWWRATWLTVTGKKQSFKLFIFPPEYESIGTVIFTVKRFGAIDMFGPKPE